MLKPPPDTLAFTAAGRQEIEQGVVPPGRDALVYWEASRIRSVLPEGTWLRAVALAVALAGVALLLGVLPARTLASVPASGRAWELVTPREPTSGVPNWIVPMGESGDTLAYRTLGPPPGSPSGSLLGGAIARRGPTGWSSEALGFPFSIFTTNIFSLLAPEAFGTFSEDFDTALWLATVPLTPASPPEGQLGLYRVVGSGAPQFIASIGKSSTYGFRGFADMSRDGEAVVFSTAEHLLPGDAGRTSGESVYAWREGVLRQIDLGAGGALLSTCGSTVSHANGMSVSGQRVFLTAPATSGCEGTKRVYLRDLKAGTTTEISASQCTRSDCNAAQDVVFEGATPDGSSAFLVTAQQLTNDDEDEGRDLYRYDVGSGQLHLLSGGSPEASGQVNEAVVYPSDDGSRVYFRATGVMVPGETNAEQKLFLADGGGMHLVAIADFPGKAEIQLSQSGTRAVFVTTTNVLEADTDSKQDVYLYDAGEGLVRRISAGPSGGDAAFDANLKSSLPYNELQDGNERPVYGIDASGNRVVFITAEPLVAADVNEQPDVYEWHDGELGLVSSGSEEVPVEFGGISRDGKTVLFETTATLTWQDEDGGDTDFYAARLGGGFPQPHEPPVCEGAACASTARPSLPSPATAAAGSGQPRRIRLLRIRSRGAGKAIGSRTLLFVSVPKPGLVTASVFVRRHGKKLLLAVGRRGVVRPGKAAIRLRLTGVGRRRHGGGLRRGRLAIRQPGVRGLSRRVRLSLGGAR